MSKIGTKKDWLEFECPACGSDQILTNIERCEFPYREKDQTVKIQANIPVRTCLTCQFTFTDYEADDAKHEAVCNYLGVLPPSKIEEIRTQYGLSRSDFSKLTGIGEASLARWETGELIQNVANDRYLFLLNYEDNIKRLEHREGLLLDDGSTKIDFISSDFQCLEGSELVRLKKEAAVFSLI